jgi:oligoribonuclease
MSHPEPPCPAYLWFDTEFTTLEFEQAQLLQVALVITTPELKRRIPHDEDVNLYVQAPAPEALSPWVRENLEHVLRHCRAGSAIDPGEVDGRLCDAIDARLGPPDPDIGNRPVIAGNSVHADYYLSRRLLPGLLERCHYRILDVSTLKMLWLHQVGTEPFDKDQPDLVRRYWPEARIDAASLAHDAYYDVQASIAELAFYRRHLLARPA